MTSLPLGTRENIMDGIEIAAPSLDEAIAQAAEQLGVEKGQVSYTLVEESKGLFGKGQVRIRASATEPGAAPAKKTRAKKPAEKPTVKAPTKAVVETVEAPPAAPAAKVARPAKTVKPAKTAEPEPAPDAESEPAVDVVATPEDAETILGMLNGLLGDSGLQVTAKVSELTGKYVNISLSGSDAGFLVGRRGEVLNALQYLLNVISARQLSNGVRVVVDGDDYRRRRQEVLEKLALDIAEEVKKRGEEAVLDALPAFERRVIHQALSGFVGVVTYSEGEEPERRVVIAPSES